MPFVPILIICALVFLLCFLVDTALKHLFPKSQLEKEGHVVRPPRRSVVIGILLLFLAVVVLLFWIPEGGDVLLVIGSIAAAVIGIVLLISYFSLTIFYDEDSFLYKPLRGKKTEYSYSQIRGQRSLVTRGGIQTTLFVGDDSIELSESLQNVSSFLSKAFYRWCSLKGIDPDSVENNPSMLTWFPDPDDAPEENREE